MLINLSNHPSAKWSQDQILAASEYGKIVDMAFPPIDPELSDVDVNSLADEYQKNLLQLSMNKQEAVILHIMGEFTFTFALVNRLKSAGIRCVASTTRRNVTENPDGTKTTVFEFVRFREYR